MATDTLAFFLQDGAALSENLNLTLRRLKEQPENPELVHEAFRYVHSIKSEAAYLKVDAIAGIALEMETRLGNVRSGEEASSPALIDALLESVARIVEELFHAAQAGIVDRLDAVDDDAERHFGPHLHSEGRTETASRTDFSIPEFSTFERTLLREAWEREERLYRVECEIAESALIKYAKAYLVANNLEIVSNVVRTVPRLEPGDDESFARFQVYITTSVPLGTIRDAIDVDEIDNISISELQFESFESLGSGERPFERRTAPADTTIELPVATYHEVVESVSEVLLSLRDQGGDPSTFSLLRRLQSALKELPAISLGRELRYLPRFARDLARAIGKRVAVQIQGGEQVSDRRIVERLADPLLHLVRNAVDHGIELPEEREAAGKPPGGTVTVSVSRGGGSLTISVADDGRGIDGDAIRLKAQAGGPDDILAILVRPGFTTRERADAISGRGVGLDIVYQQVVRALGGTLSLDSTVGKGSTFTLAVPEGSSYTSLLLFRSGAATAGLPVRNIARRIAAAEATGSDDGEGFLAFDGLPVFRIVDGKVERERSVGKSPESRLVGDEGALLVLRYVGMSVCFVADELLFERDIHDQDLASATLIAPSLYRVRVEGGSAEFLFPALANLL